MSFTDPGMARQIAENEARFRDANERIEAAFERLEPNVQTIPFVCECGRPDCLQILRLTLKQYESVRQHPRYFACAPGHQITGEGLGRVVQEHSTFVVAEKTGVAGAVAEDHDPRQEDRQTPAERRHNRRSTRVRPSRAASPEGATRPSPDRISTSARPRRKPGAAPRGTFSRSGDAAVLPDAANGRQRPPEPMPG